MKYRPQMAQQILKEARAWRDEISFSDKWRDLYELLENGLKYC